MSARSSSCIQKTLNSAHENRFLFNLALPNDHHAPASPTKFPPDFRISRLVLGEFWLPKRAIRSRLPILLAGVLVPKASMHEDYPFPGAKDKIRIAWQVRRMQAVSVAHLVNEPPNDHFRLCVDISDKRHAFTALCRSQRIISPHLIVSFGPKAS